MIRDRLKKFKENYASKLKVIDLKPKETFKTSWIIKITLGAFILSILFSYLSETFVPDLHVVLGILVIGFFIVMGIVFDVIGVAVTSTYEAPFHSMASKRVRGAKNAINLIKNAEKVAAFCNDVVGDVCGIVSGSTGILIADSISEAFHVDQSLMALVVTAVVASLTIGGKAVGKTIAINKSDVIVFKVGQLLSFIKR